MERIPMTTAGHQALEDELQQLKTVERHAVIKMIAEARAHGDLSENAEYHAAKDRQSFIEGRMMDLEDKLSRAEIIDLSKLSGKAVTFGDVLLLADGDAVKDAAKAKVTGEIVGHGKGEKIIVFRYKNKTRSRKRTGHRSKTTTVKITKIEAK